MNKNQESKFEWILLSRGLSTPYFPVYPLSINHYRYKEYNIVFLFNKLIAKHLHLASTAYYIMIKTLFDIYEIQREGRVQQPSLGDSYDGYVAGGYRNEQTFILKRSNSTNHSVAIHHFFYTPKCAHYEK